METTYAAQATTLSNEELLAILQNTAEYEPEAILAVIAELETREVLIPEVETLKAEALATSQVKQEEQPVQATGAAGYVQLFVPQQGYFITPILLNLNLLVYILMVLAGVHFLEPNAEHLYNIGANYGPSTLTGQWWRLFTSTFIHGGLIHLVLNMVALVSVGRQLELVLGRGAFLISYILCGLAGSLVSVWWDGSRVSVGASGAIFGMFGLLLILLAFNAKLSWKDKRSMLGNMVLVIGMNLAFGMQGNIDNAAHAGGLATGIVLGVVLLLRSGRLTNTRFNWKGNVAMAASGLLALSVAYYLVPFNAESRYVYTINKVIENDAEAMKVMELIAEAGDAAKNRSDVLVPQLEAGVKIWDESEVMLEAIDDVTGKERDKVLVMLDYVRLRKISYQMFIDDLKQNRQIFNPKQNQVLNAIDSYASALRRGTESDEVDSRFKENKDAENTPEADMPPFSIVGEDTQTEEEKQAKPEKVLLVVDGEKKGFISPENMPVEVAGLDDNKIKDITVLKGQAARSAYGSDGAQGVLVITTKK